MELTIIDQLLFYLVEEPRNTPMATQAAGYEQDKIRGLERSPRSRSTA